MDKHKREEFKGFCRQTTDRQVLEILRDERARAAGEEEAGVEDGFFAACAEIALAEVERRGLTP